ncbi:MAG: sulfite exporter TauE/SafE family protein [Candidatus Sericytochromatia bacterium]|nr:sulfite exporter TauE/SafE family protein [Candidatus Sericytochromatia bacterium]
MVIALITFLLATVCGGVGALLGMGGGVFLVPALTLFLHVPIKTAIGASVISVIAASAMAGALAAGTRMNHVRLALALEVTTTLGVLAGGLTAIYLSAQALMAVFAVVALTMAAVLVRQPAQDVLPVQTGLLDTSFVDPRDDTTVTYGVRRLPTGLAAAFVSGNVSGLLGIGGGVIAVPVMNLIMGTPIKAAIATSNFMVGMTAAASAMIYYQAGFIHPDVAAPAALGVLLGARLSTVWGMRAPHGLLRRLLLAAMVAVAVQMLVKAWQS